MNDMPLRSLFGGNLSRPAFSGRGAYRVDRLLTPGSGSAFSPHSGFGTARFSTASPSSGSAAAKKTSAPSAVVRVSADSALTADDATFLFGALNSYGNTFSAVYGAKQVFNNIEFTVDKAAMGNKLLISNSDYSNNYPKNDSDKYIYVYGKVKNTGGTSLNLAEHTYARFGFKTDPRVKQTSNETVVGMFWDADARSLGGSVLAPGQEAVFLVHTTISADDFKLFGQASFTVGFGDRFKNKPESEKDCGRLYTIPFDISGAVYYYSTGSSYVGGWFNGSADGKGRYTWPNGDFYKGDWSGGCINGKGIYTWANGNRYEGDWSGGKRHGKGVKIDANGDRYEGFYVSDKRHGKGIMTYADGRRYDGGWADGKKNGKGVFTWPDGDRYDGGWSDDTINGKGIYIWANGNRYDGEWSNGKKNGKGIFTWPDGDHYNGYWSNDAINGKGIYVWANGDRYEGNWKNGKKSGRGVYHFTDGRRYDGNYVDDKMDGKGVYTWPDGGRYDGDWSGGMRHGKGTMTYAFGAVFEGQFVNDNPHHGIYTQKNGVRTVRTYKADGSFTETPC